MSHFDYVNENCFKKEQKAETVMNHDLIYFPETFPGRREKVYVSEGEKVVSAGSYPHYVYVVISGSASVSYTTGKGKAVEASRFLPGDFIGEMNAVCSQFYIFDAVALTDMELWKIPAEDFIRAMEQDFRLVKSMIQSQNNRINYLEAYCIINDTFSLYEKVLLYFCCIYSTDEGMSIGKEQIVTTLGTDLRSFNRVLAKMRDKKLIRVNRGRIHILNHNALLEEAKERNIEGQINIFYDFVVDAPGKETYFDR